MKVLWSSAGGRHRQRTAVLPLGITAVGTGLALLVTLGSPAAIGAVGRDLAVNGGFESGLSGWRTNDKAVQILKRIVPGRDGSKGAARLSTTALSNAVLNDSVNTVASTARGAKYQASAWVKALKPGLSGQLRLRETTGGSLIGVGATSFHQKDTGWQHVTVSYTTTGSGSTLDLNVLGWNVAPGQGLLVDDVRLIDAATATATVKPTATATATATVKPTATATATVKPTVKPTATATATMKPTVKPTATATATVKPTPTASPTASPTGSPTGCLTGANRGIPKCGVVFGAAVGGNADPASRESQVNGTLGIRRTYFRSDQVSGAITTAKADLAKGRLPWISFKLPYSWSEMAAGKGDAWAADIATRLAALPGPVWVAFHHEPETDGDMTEWTRMQARLSPIIRASSNVAFTIVLTGWHQFYGTDSAYHMDNLWPGDDLVDLVGFDIYNNYGVAKDGATNTSFTELKSYYAKIAPWAANHDVAWGVAESGYTDAAAAKDPAWLQRAYTDMESYGGVALTYFDSQLNSVGSWALNTSVKIDAFGKVLKGSDKL